ncbi:MAG: internal scaffolding protein [Microviridae sp.]|nr:MAG: internal scaffolding protein [Microviridae sp.]
MDFPTRYSVAGREKLGGLDCSNDQGRTVQSAKDECDLNAIMKKYIKTGELPPGIGIGRFGDFSDVTDYLEAQNTLIQARQQFDSLPSGVRERFRNDPAALLAFVNDRKNLDEARTLGLLKDEPVKGAGALPVEPAKPAEVKNG